MILRIRPALLRHVFGVFLAVSLLPVITSKRNCSSNVCFNGGVCVVDDAATVFQCECRPGFSGTLCESALPCDLDCRNGGLCSFDAQNKEKCVCPEGFTGDLCTATADCLETGCIEGEVCLVDPKSGKWSCAIDLCMKNEPCLHNATCRPTRDSYICECTRGFRGRRCEVVTDHCADSPCLNGARCKNRQDGFDCECKDGFNGTVCEQKVGLCVGRPCGDHGTCVDGPDGDYECQCLAGYSGRNCENAVAPCTCENPHHECHLGPDSQPVCQCPNGTQGDTCDESVDLCVIRNPCRNGGQCIANGNSTFCICPSGFSGSFCEQKLDDCFVDEKPCLNGGRCVRGETNRCECQGRFMGKWCEQMRLNAHLNTSSTTFLTTASTATPKGCSSGFCGNGGKCSLQHGKPVCACAPEFTGAHCESSVQSDPCHPNPCMHDGVCSFNGSIPSCFCLESFTGARCEIPCSCKANELCRESIRKPGTPECLTVPEPELLFPDNNEFAEDFEPSSSQSTTFTSTRVFSAHTKLPTTNLPTSSSPFAHAEVTEATTYATTTYHVDSFVHAITASTASSVPEVFMPPGNVDELLNVTSCDDCVNAHRCVEITSRYVCLCKEDFGGPYCDEPSSPCSTLTCPTHQVCRLQRSGTVDVPQCVCPPGFFGVNCQEPTTASFHASSLLLHQPSPTESADGYVLQLSFRTTVADVHLVTGESLLNSVEFNLQLADGQLILTLDDYTAPVIDLPLNDAEWYSVWLNSSQQGVFVEIEDGASGFILTRKRMQHKPLSVFTTRFGRLTDSEFFIGCLRDVFVNGRLVDLLTPERAVDIEAGCVRETQCRSDSCQNGATCIDLWSSFRCECVRPFLEPNCVDQLTERTFGHDNASSFVEFSVDEADARLIRQKTDVSFLLRTNSPNGVLFFLGNRTDDEDSVGTFLGAEMADGHLVVSGRLGGRKMMTVVSDKFLDDNKHHLVELQRVGNELKVRIDGKSDGTLRFRHPFEHPLLADSLVLGDRAPVKQALFSPQGHFFKGTLQDVRVNAKSVMMGDENIDVPSFGYRQLDQNVLKGTVSDDVCNEVRPCKQGKCFNTFNDYECQCDAGWIGRDCARKDFCAEKPCPSGSDCANTFSGYVCVSAATFHPLTTVKYAIQLTSPPSVTTLRLETNFTMEVRTRSTEGQILKLQASTDSITLQLTPNGLDIVYSNATTVMHDPVFFGLANGQWHSVQVREHNQKLFLDFDRNDSPAPLLAPFSLTRFLLDKNARVFLGKAFNASGFTGCLQNVAFSDLPPLSFLAPEIAQGHLDAVTHFQATQRENLKADGCVSREVCGAVNPCRNGAACVDLFNARECRCTHGFEGELCEVNRDECALLESPCNGHGRCVDGVGDTTCQCRQGFSGSACATLVDACRSNPCQNGAACKVDASLGNYSCICGQEFFGRRCQQRRSVSCAARPCENGGSCRESDQGVQCACPPGFHGPLCEDVLDHCLDQPCVNGATCTANQTHFQCHCAPNFAGETCSEFADACHAHDNYCVHGACRNVWGGAVCHCDQGYTGARCDIDVDECAEFPCANNGTCVNTAGSFHCQCAPFFLGAHCETAGVCTTQPCVHGTCVQHSATEHSCTCAKGYTGPRCEEQIDYCRDEPCVNGGTCQKLVGGFRCHCIAGFTDDTCATDIDDCVPGACANNGRCLDQVNGFACACNGTGFQGAQCTEDIDECSPQLVGTHCINGVCTNAPGSYRCVCEDFFIGERCSVVNPCVPDALNRTRHNCVHGSCVNPTVVMLPSGREVAQHDCLCHAGYTGPQCTHLVERQRSIALAYVLGPVAAVLVIMALLACMLFLFVVKNKRANQGHYSPSGTEQLGARMQMYTMEAQKVQLPPRNKPLPERLI